MIFMSHVPERTPHGHVDVESMNRPLQQTTSAVTSQHIAQGTYSAAVFFLCF